MSLTIRQGSVQSAEARRIFLRMFRTEPLADPYPMYARLRALAPVLSIRHPRFPRGYLVSTQELCAALFRDPDFTPITSAALDTLAPGWRDNPFATAMHSSLMFSSGAAHRKLRAAVGHFLGPRVVEQRRAEVVELADSLLDGVADLGRSGEPVDIAEALALPYASLVTGLLLGLDPQESLRLGRLTRQCGAILEMACPVEDYKDMLEPAGEIIEALHLLVEKRRLQPREDMVSELTRLYLSEHDREQLINDLVLLMIGGVESPARTVGLGVRLLLERPEQARILREDPTVVHRAVAEIIRYDPAFQLIPRMASKPTRFAGIDVLPGDVMLACVAAANRDPDYVADPDRFDVTRPASIGLGMAGGPHYCLGAAMGQLQMEVLFPRLLRRFPAVAAAGAPVFRAPGTTLRGCDHLPVRLHQVIR
ncbi:cytochrome P450 [Streptomyces sp. NPDC048527]|uniref:cytochrome P450 n=1 Tax=Streptomyces sp. NPDC048527 TaxID=3365568 RepID=UPI003711EEB9